MPLDFPSNPVDRQVSGNFYWDAASTAWRNVGSKNGLSTRVTNLEVANASTNMAGLVPVIPSSVAVGSGSASVSASGMVTFTGASTVSLNGCFSSTFDNYVMTYAATGSVDSGWSLRLRTGGTDSNANYAWEMFYASNAGGTVSSNNVLSSDKFGNIFGHQVQRGTFQLIQPAVATFTGITFQGIAINSAGTNAEQHTSSSIHRVSTVYDGLTLICGSGTFSGTVHVYGYRN